MKKNYIFLILFFSVSALFAQEHQDFKIINQIKTSSVKDQGMTGTCWSFATISFLETEFIRKNEENLDLSEMYIVYKTYLQKADYYVKLHGTGNFSQGGQAHDVINTAKIYGLMPQSAFEGKKIENNNYDHSELEKLLKNYIDSIIKLNPIPKDWKENYIAFLDKEIGEIPEKFKYNNDSYNSKLFSTNFMNFNPDDYIELTSYSHHDFYTKFDLEVPDNWSHDDYYNLPINDLMEVINYAFANGYSICWDGDVSEKNFDFEKGKAELSKEDIKLLNSEGIQEARQITFENQTSTDDHLMHLTGQAEDKNGKIYYQTKNSWGAESNDYGGFLYMSEDFVKMKTIAIMVNKNGLPEEIKTKLGL